jgi:hypothetical protein
VVIFALIGMVCLLICLGVAFVACLALPWFPVPGEGPFLLCVLLFSVGLVLWAIVKPLLTDEEATSRMQPPDVKSLPPYRRPEKNWRSGRG